MLICINALYSYDAKIKQMLFVTQEDTHDKKSDCIYYVTEDNKLYCLSVPKHSNKSIKTKISSGAKKPLKLYEKFNPENLYPKYQKIKGNRVILIGKPVYVNDIWSMPAVIKKPGFIGKILRPDIYTIEYKVITVMPKESKNRYEMYETDDDEQMRFGITKQYEGHRTKVVTVGITQNYNSKIQLMSSSEWPTIKSKELNNTNNTEVVEYKEQFLLAINKNFYTPLEAKKSFFNKKTYTIKYDNIYNLDYLPLVTFDQTDDQTEKKLDQNTVNIYLNQITKLTYKNRNILYLSKDTNSYIVILNKKEKKLDLIKIKRIKDSSMTFSAEIKIENKQVTAYTFDYNNEILYYAIYDSSTKEAAIKSKNMQKDAFWKDKIYNENEDKL